MAGGSNNVIAVKIMHQDRQRGRAKSCIWQGAAILSKHSQGQTRA